jgi:hypothetical protein
MEPQVHAISDLSAAAYLFALRIRVVRLQPDPLNPRQVSVLFDNADGVAARAELEYAGGALIQAQRVIDAYKGLKSVVLNYRDNERRGGVR